MRGRDRTRAFRGSMADGTLVAGLIGLFALVAALSFYLGALWRQHRTAAAIVPSKAQGRITVLADLDVTGTLEVAGDVVMRRSSANGDGKYAELDVPTHHVDRLVQAMQVSGIEVWETGETVDTDEGEETLTTVRLDLATLEKKHPTARPDDVLHVLGGLTVQTGCLVACNLRVDGALTLQDQVRVRGNVWSRGPLAIGVDCIVEGEAASDDRIEMGAGSRAKAFRSGGAMRIADPTPEMPAKARA